jgi:hypothetical protein
VKNKKAKPTKPVDDWTNPVIDACQIRLKGLEQKSRKEAEKSAGLTTDAKTLSSTHPNVDPSGSSKNASTTADASQPSKRAGRVFASGLLSSGQIETLVGSWCRDLKTWVGETATEWGKDSATLWENMGIDNPERRGTSFWNIFQNVWWSRLSEKELKGISSSLPC